MSRLFSSLIAPKSTNLFLNKSQNKSKLFVNGEHNRLIYFTYNRSKRRLPAAPFVNKNLSSMKDLCANLIWVIWMENLAYTVD